MSTEFATFAAGCFWGVEETFRKLPGVQSTTVGYTGGATDDPTYEQVCTDRTGHAEAVQITYDSSVLPYEQLLEVFWSAHDPTQVDGQGPDRGTQYRSSIFFHTPDQERIARASKVALEAAHRFARPIATSIVPATPFHRAEEYHQQYLAKRGLGTCHI